MGLLRAGIGVVKAAAKGGSATDVGVAAAKGMLPKRMGGLVDKVATPDNISRVQQGVRNVVDAGRSGTMKSQLPTPPAAAKNKVNLPKPPPFTFRNPNAR